MNQSRCTRTYHVNQSRYTRTYHVNQLVDHFLHQVFLLDKFCLALYFMLHFFEIPVYQLRLPHACFVILISCKFDRMIIKTNNRGQKSVLLFFVYWHFCNKLVNTCFITLASLIASGDKGFKTNESQLQKWQPSFLNLLTIYLQLNLYGGTFLTSLCGIWVVVD